MTFHHIQWLEQQAQLCEHISAMNHKLAGMPANDLIVAGAQRMIRKGNGNLVPVVDPIALTLAR